MKGALDAVEVKGALGLSLDYPHAARMSSNIKNAQLMVKTILAKLSLLLVFPFRNDRIGQELDHR
jgi:hypothetical protein